MVAPAPAPFLNFFSPTLFGFLIKKKKKTSSSLGVKTLLSCEVSRWCFFSWTCWMTVKTRCSLTTCPHLVSSFLVGEKPVSFYAAFISVCISGISLVVKKKKRQKKETFLVVLKKRKEKKKRLIFRSCYFTLIGFFFFNFPKTSMLHGMLTYWCFCKRDVHKCILHCHDDSLGMLFFFLSKLFLNMLEQFRQV